MNWQDLIPGCFGAVDQLFARHELDKARAREMLVAAGNAGASWDDVSDALRAHLLARGCSAAHIDAELEAAGRTAAYF